MRRDEFEQREQAARDVTNAIGRASDDIRVPPHFAARVMAKAESLSSPRSVYFHWRSAALAWMSSRRLRVAMALVFVLALSGAVPQYATWFKAFTAGVPSTTLHTALEQERLWEKNFTCATRLDQNSKDYAAIEGDSVHVVVWGLPFRRRAHHHGVAPGNRLPTQRLGSVDPFAHRGKSVAVAGPAGPGRCPALARRLARGPNHPGTVPAVAPGWTNHAPGQTRGWQLPGRGHQHANGQGGAKPSGALRPAVLGDLPLIFLLENGSTYGVSGTAEAHSR